MRVLITGANGFVGSALSGALKDRGMDVVRATRRPEPKALAVGSIGGATDWSAALQKMDAVVHLAACVHAPRENLAAFYAVNVEGTMNLARQAAAAGVKRFIYISSVKAHGEGRAEAYTEKDKMAPVSHYGQSKWQAEQGLRLLARHTPLEVVILRPPVVYGPGVRSDFLRLMKWIDRGVPLPFKNLHQPRSMLYIGNLVDAIALCLTHRAAPGKIFLLSDGEDISIAVLVRKLADAMGRPCRSFSLPSAFFRGAAYAVGRSARMAHLLNPLQVDSAAIQKEIGWAPPYTLAQGLQKTVDGYRLGSQRL